MKTRFRNAGNENFVKAFDIIRYENTLIMFHAHNFYFKNFYDIADLEDYFKSKFDAGFIVRLVAGFCSRWSDPKSDGSLIPDVIINHWERPWNRKTEDGKSSNPSDHPYTIWATKLIELMSQIACIYSIQGFEFDYIGVIWGKDLINGNGQWIALPQHTVDTEFKSQCGSIKPEIALPFLKNAYRVLWTRDSREWHKLGK